MRKRSALRTSFIVNMFSMFRASLFIVNMKLFRASPQVKNSRGRMEGPRLGPRGEGGGREGLKEAARLSTETRTAAAAPRLGSEAEDRLRAAGMRPGIADGGR